MTGGDRESVPYRQLISFLGIISFIIYFIHILFVVFFVGSRNINLGRGRGRGREIENICRQDRVKNSSTVKNKVTFFLHFNNDSL